MKETHYKLKHRVTALFAAAVMLCSMLPGAAFAEEPTPQPTEETAQMEQQTEPSETDNGQTDESSPDPGEDVTEATPETAEEQPAEEEISAAVVGAELYTDLPDAPIGSYIGSEGLPVATGETKIGISEWPESQLEEGGSYLTAVALDNDGLTMAAPLLDGADYAIVPIMAQVEYPADGSSTDMILPDGVTLLDFYGEPATDADALLHNSYHETSAAVIGVYVQAAADFNAQLVYTGPDGSTQTKTLYVTIDREHTVASPFADAGIAAYGERPIPDVTSGKITKVAKVNGTWLIWFNGEPAYCCTPGADGQPKNCPTYTYVNTSMVGADQYVPGDHYGNQYRIWGGLTQLSLGMQELPPVALSAEAPSLLDSCRTIYTDAQMQIIENYPDSTAAKILIGSAQTLLEGTDTYASARGYYTYIYQPGRAGWQTVAVIGPEISDDEPNPKPIVQEIYANWEAPAQTASGSFDFDYGIITNKVQLKTTEKVDGATIEIEPITKSGTIDGGTWNISPADKQTVTTAGHTNDDNFQNNGGAASASWTLHYSVSKTTDSRNGRVGPYTTQDEADAAADSARDAAIAELQGEAQRMVDNAVASAKAELANVKFRYEEVGVPLLPPTALMALSRNCRTWATRSNTARVWNTWRCAIKTLNEISALTGSTRAFPRQRCGSITANCTVCPPKCSRNTGRKTPRQNRNGSPQNYSPLCGERGISASCRAGIPKCPALWLATITTAPCCGKPTTARAQSAATFCCVRIFCCSADTSSRQNSYGKTILKLWMNCWPTRKMQKSKSNSLPASAKFCIAKNVSRNVPRGKKKSNH